MDVIGNAQLSVVTVCYNTEQNIAKTIESVLQQKGMEQCEYLIKDGNSTDATEEIVHTYAAIFKEKGIPFFYYTEEDTGIYNAMNVSIDKCVGKWILFMNAGDCFYEESTISHILQAIENVPQNVGVIYGNTQVTLCNGQQIFVRADHTQLKSASSICHQSCLVKAEHLRQMKFDERYSVAADRELLIRLMEQGVGFHKIDYIISCYERGGRSNRSFVASFQDKYELEKQHDLLPARYSYGRNLLIARCKDLLAKCIPGITDWVYLRKNRK